MLICILVIAYVASDQDIFSPWIIATASFLNSSVLAMLNRDYWQYDFHVSTCLVIVVALLLFGAGAMIAGWAVKRDAGTVCEKPSRPLAMPAGLIMAVSVVILLLAAVSFQDSYHLSVFYGNTDGYGNMLPTVRRLLESKEAVLPRGVAYRNLISLTAAVFFMYTYLHDMVWFGWRRASCLCLLPTLVYIPHAVLSTARGDFLTVTVVAILLAGIQYQIKNGCSGRNNLRLLGGMMAAFVLFFSAFFAAGSLTWKGLTETRGPFRIISHYTGAQIPAFDAYLNGRAYPEDEWIGTHSLIGPYSNMRALGMEVPETSIFLEFTAFENVDTNVYTSLRRYIQDYGFVGMGLIVFLLGLIYTTAYNLVRKRAGGGFALLMYVMFSWPFFMFGHDDLFMTTVLSARTIYILISMGFFYWIGMRCCKHNEEGAK